MSVRVILLCPSQGLGGGIERYVQAVEWAFSEKGVSYQRIDLRQAGVQAHRVMLADLLGALRSAGGPTRLVLAHLTLLPVARLAVRQMPVQGISVLCHGCEVWGPSLRPRWWVQKTLMRSPDVRVVGVSSFTAGTLLGTPVTILPPGVTRTWFDTLAGAAERAVPRGGGVRIVTVFRLEDWREKGVPVILDALASLGRADTYLTVCGSGVPPEGLLRAVHGHERCAVRGNLTDHDLAAELAAADLMVLATRTRRGRRSYGEGFGLVLLESQLAGTPVIAPAHGGSHDTFLDQVTGVAPVDESAAALADTLGELLRAPARLAQMGKRAGDWARERFEPESYASTVITRLL